MIPCVNATGPLEGSNRHQVLGADTPPGEAKTTLRLAVGDSWTVAVSGPNLQPVTEYRSGCFVLGPPLMIEPQRTYRLRVRYQPVGHLRAAILDVFGQTLWDTGRVPAYGRLSFDRVRFGVDFVACDNPHANRLTIHILAAVAEHEATQISERTRVSLAAYKARGGKLGASRPECRNLSQKARKKGAAAAGEAVRRKADAAYADLKNRISEMRSGGATYQEIADSLNEQGHTTQRGKPWSHVAVMRVCKRYGIAA